MTRLAVIGDIHTAWGRLDKVLDRVRMARVDGILLVGDLACAGRQGRRTPAHLEGYARDVKAVLARVRQVGPPVLWVPGNHDLPLMDGHGLIDGRLRRLGDLRIFGIGGAPISAHNFAYEWPDDDPPYKKVPTCDVLLCHCPPANTPLDRVPRVDRNVGSRWIRRLAESHRGVLVCGHIHESPGFVRIKDCLCLNVGGIGNPFGRAQLGFVEGPDQLVYEDLENAVTQHWTR